MAKLRKTRQEKIATANKRQESQVTYSFSHITKAQEIKHRQPTTAYGYVIKDIRKTFAVSLSLLLLQIILFILLQHHVVKIPGVIY